MRVRLHRLAILAAVILTATALAVPAATSGASPSSWQSKVAPRVIRDTAHGGTASFLVVMAPQADVSSAGMLSSKEAKGRFVFDTLGAHAERTQSPVRRLLDRLGIHYSGHWL